jgi:hypothetical protein
MKLNKNLGVGILAALVIVLLSSSAYADLYLNSKSGYINLNTTGQTRMQITPGGNLDLLGLANVSIPRNLSVGGNTLFVDSNDNRIGIGATGPAVALHINGSGSDDQFRVE